MLFALFLITLGVAVLFVYLFSRVSTSLAEMEQKNFEITDELTRTKAALETTRMRKFTNQTLGLEVDYDGIWQLSGDVQTFESSTSAIPHIGTYELIWEREGAKLVATYLMGPVQLRVIPLPEESDFHSLGDYYRVLDSEEDIWYYGEKTDCEEEAETNCYARSIFPQISLIITDSSLLGQSDDLALSILSKD